MLVLPFLVLLSVLVGWYAVNNMMSLFASDKELIEEVAQEMSGGNPAAAAEEKEYLNPVERWVAMRTPVIDGMPWTAPMFEDVQEVKVFPKPHCIIHSMEDAFDLGVCQCYSQQMTKIQNVNEHVCRQLAMEGWFDYTQEDSSRRGGHAPHGRVPALAPQRQTINKSLRREKAEYVGAVSYADTVQVGDPRPGRAIRVAANQLN